jgi:hypothetical protein
MANNSLSPNRTTQRMLKYRAAVMTIARYRAKQAVKADIRAGLVASSSSPRISSRKP